MKGLYYEDFKIDDKFTSRAKTITEGIISILVSLGGYTVSIFNNKEYAKTTALGWQAAPGRVAMLMVGGLKSS